jgi:hypothetical protein
MVDFNYLWSQVCDYLLEVQLRRKSFNLPPMRTLDVFDAYV